MNWHQLRAQRIENEIHRLTHEQELRLGSLAYKGGRLLIRVGRIALGLAMLIVAFFVIGATPNVSDTPFASLTLGAIFWAVAGWCFGLWLGFLAFGVAFGEGPRRSSQYDIRQAAEEAVDRRFPRPLDSYMEFEQVPD